MTHSALLFFSCAFDNKGSFFFFFFLHTYTFLVNITLVRTPDAQKSSRNCLAVYFQESYKFADFACSSGGRLDKLELFGMGAGAFVK